MARERCKGLTLGLRVHSLPLGTFSGLAHASILHNLSRAPMSIYHNKQCVCSSGPCPDKWHTHKCCWAQRGRGDSPVSISRGLGQNDHGNIPQLSSKALPGKGHPPTHTPGWISGDTVLSGKDQSLHYGCGDFTTHIFRTPCW